MIYEFLFDLNADLTGSKQFIINGKKVINYEIYCQNKAFCLVKDIKVNSNAFKQLNNTLGRRSLLKK